MNHQDTTPAEQTSVDRENPYLGLQSFREQDHDFFHGRDSEIESLLRLVRRDVLTVLFGMSGLGKTSLLNAGLFPKLRKSMYLPVSIRLDFGEKAPDLITQIKNRVAVEVENYCIDTPSPSEHETLWEHFHRTHFWNQQNRLLTPVLVFDQFEEMFTLGRGNDRVVPFLQELSDVIENHIPEAVRAHLENSGEELSFSYDKPSIKIIFSLREDYLAHLEELRHSIPSLSRNRYRLTRMDGERALEAVSIPGEHLLTREVAQSIVLFTAGAAGYVDLKELEVEPALLSLVCRELNSRRQESDLPRISSELLSGSKDRIIADFYENNISSIDPGVRVFVEEDLLTASGFRSTKALDDALQLPGVSKQAIDTLVNLRLVRLEDRLGIQHVELIHDVLAGVIQESRERRHQEEAVAELERAAQERRRKWRKRVVAIGLAVIILVGIIVDQWRKAEKDRLEAEQRAKAGLSGEMVAVSTQNRGTDPMLSLILARAACKANDTPQAQGALHHALAVSQIRNNLEGHQRSVRDVAYSPDGKSVATASDDKTAKLWDAETGEIRHTLKGHRRRIAAIAFSPKGKWLATAGDDNTAKLWDVETDEVRHSLKGHRRRIAAIAFSPNGKWLATASDDKTAKLWDVEKGKERHHLDGHEDRVTAVAFSPYGKWLATGSKDKKVKLWDVETGEERLPPLEGHKGRVTAVAFSSHGRIATASSDGTVILFNSSGTELHQFKGHQSPVSDVAFSPDGTRLAIANQDRVQVWDSKSRELLFTLSGHTADVIAIAFSSDGNRLATASKDKTAKLWNVQYNEELPTLIGHTKRISALAYSPDGERLATASDDHDHSVRIWNPGTGVEVNRLEHSNKVTSVAFSPDGRLIATGSEDEKARLWDKEKGTELRTFKGHLGGITAVAFSPDDRHLLATASKDGTARLWDVESGEEMLVIGSLSDGRPVYDVTFNPDGKSVATANGDGTIKLWGISGELIRSYQVGSNYDVVFDPSGNRLAATKSNGEVIVWNLESDEEPTAFKGHKQRFSDIAFNPAGTLLATASDDNTVKLWHMESGRELFELMGYDAPVTSVAFSPDKDSQRLAAGDEQGTIHQYTLDIDQLIQLAKIRITRQLTDEECGSYRFIPDCQAASLVKQGQEYARTEQLDRAIDIFKKAQEIDTSLQFDDQPDAESYAKALAAKALSSTARRYASNGEIIRAREASQRAHQYNPDIPLDVEEINRLAAQALVRKGRDLAGKGDANEAIAAFNEALKLDPAIKIDKENETAKGLAVYGRKLARDGKVEDAQQAFSKALKLNTSIDIAPEAEVAKGLVEYGRKLARDGKVEDAQQAFSKALKLNPSIDITPKSEIAKSLVTQGQKLGQIGKVDEAVKTLHKALEFDPNVKVNIKEETAKALVQKGRNDVKAGRVKEAIAEYEKAQKKSPGYKITSEKWNDLCWHGCLWGHAADVIPACDTAVNETDGKDVGPRDSRGVALAVTGDFKGAIRDFKYYVQFGPSQRRSPERIGKRVRWIEALESGGNPFTPSVLKALRSE